MIRHAVSLGHRAAAALLMIMGATACGDVKPPAPPVAAQRAEAVGGTVIVSVPTDVETLYPPAVKNSLDLVVVNSVFDRLADIGEDLNTVGDSGFKPQLARGWTWAPDSLSIAFRLDSMARWHDGQPVRAEDVRFTFRAYTDSLAALPNAGYLSNIDSVHVADSLTAVVWFKRRMPQQFFQATYYMYVLPSHILARIPLDRLSSDSITTVPVGSGRFRFVRWDARSRVELASDTGNYRKRAKLDRVIFAIAGGVQGATLSVFSGSADFFEKLQPEDLPQVALTPTLRAIPYSQVGYSFLTFNLHGRRNRQQPHPVFSDARVRRALTMAVDREASTRAVLDSFGQVSIGPSPRVMFRNASELKQIPYNPALARSLLDSAGWVLAPGTAVRTRNGVPLAFEIVVPSTSKPRQTYARLLEGQFRGVGAKATVRILEGSVLTANMEAGDFDAYMGALTVTPGLQALPQSWGTRGIGGRNAGGYSNPRFDATVDSALGAFQASRANALWVRAFQVILDDAPAIWLFEETSIGVIHKRIRNTTLRADAWYAGLADWSIDPAQRIQRDRKPGAFR